MRLTELVQVLPRFFLAFRGLPSSVLASRSSEACLLKVLQRRLCRRLTGALLSRGARGNGTTAVPLPLRARGWLDRPQ